MKVIDLLNKIANGEELPKRILFDSSYYFLNEKSEIQCFIEECIGTGTLNDEIKVIEESKKIEKPLYIEVENYSKLNNLVLTKISLENKHNIENLRKTLNEIIDYLNKGE